MSSIRLHVRSQSIVLMLVLILIADFLCISIYIHPVAASLANGRIWRTDLGSASSQWSPWPAKTNIQPLAADLFGDGGMEVVVTGGFDDYTETIPGTGVNGAVTCLNGADGTVIWQTRTNGNMIWGVSPNGKTVLWQQSFSGGVGTHSPFEIADLNKDGIMDIVVAALHPLALYGNNGSVMWKREDVLCYGHYPAVYDIDGSGYPTIFVTSSDGPYKKEGGKITSLSHDGQILHQTYSWHPCWGGLTVGDANFDGKFELYHGDRSIYYDEPTDPYKWGGKGVQVLDAQTLQPLWNYEEILVSSHIPMLADMNNDGFLEIVVGDQGAHGLAVLNYDGTVCTTDGIWRQNQALGIYSHSQPTVYDVDGDGNLEIISCNNDKIATEYPKIWDLRQWKLDATLSVTCSEPPKVGDVNGDGKMEIIACSDMYNDGSIAPGNQPGTIYIYDSNYNIVDTIPSAWASNMILLQDINGDSKTELVFTSGAVINAYATPTIAPTPRVRSSVQFYSERRCGVAEYVPPFPNYPTSKFPVVLNPSPPDKSIDVSVSLSKLEFLLVDFQNDKMSYTVTTSPNIGSEQGTNIASGTTCSIDVAGLKPLTKYTWTIHVNDQNDYSTDKKLTFYTNAYSPPGSPPTQSNPQLVSSAGGNTTSEDLICRNQSTFDTDGNPVTNQYVWYRNNAPLTALGMSFDTNPKYSTTVKDYSGLGNNGRMYAASWNRYITPYLSPTWGTGVVGGAYIFSEDQFIKVPGSDSLGDGTWTEITLECWIRPNDLSTQSTIIAKKTWQGTIGSYMLGFQDNSPNKLFWGVSTRGTYTQLNDTTLLNPDTWYHVVSTYKSGSGLKIYVNGALSASMSLSGVIDVGTVQEDVYIGGFRSTTRVNHYLNAALDEVRIYRRALSGQQILQRYLETKNGSSRSSTIVSSETSSSDVWQCFVTPNDSYQDGTAKASNTLTVTGTSQEQPHADIYIEHTYVGDLVVSIGAGKIDNPLWSSVVWNRKGGRGTGSLSLTIDLTGREQYLPPSGSVPYDHLWFLKVTDAALQDQGRVVWFNITYQGSTYVSSDVPQAIVDLQTTVVYNPKITSTSSAFASIYIEHTYIGDLNVTIGVGSPSAPLWSKLIWNRLGGSTDNLNLVVDLSEAVSYLPPSDIYRWFLKVYDGGTGDQGRIVWFNITYQGVTYVSSDVPVDITDFKTSYAYIPPAPFAHIYMQHTYIGDLIVDIGVGNMTSPQWSKRIWNGTGGRGPGYLDLTIDLTEAVAYLPPSSTNTWFLKVYDRYIGDTGKIVEFTIKYMGTTYVSMDVPVPIFDKQTSYAYISA